MKVSKPTALVLTVAVAAVLGGAILRGEPPSTTKAATDLELTTPGLPTDRTPERYTGSFLDTTLPAMLQRLNVAVDPLDKVYAFPDPSFGLGSTILIFRAQQVTLTDAKRVSLVRTWAKTVADFATEQNLELADADQVVPARDAPIPVQADPVVVTVTRVSEAQIVTNTVVPFSIQTVNDSDMDQGTSKVTQAGKNGNLKKTFLSHREDGVETRRTLLSSEQTVDPVTQIVHKGTRPVITVRCKFNDTVLAAASANGIDANSLCFRMMAESNGNPNSSGSGGKYQGLFQYDPNFWASVSAKAGYPDASIWDATSQINVTAWAWAHGYRGRWPNP